MSVGQAPTQADGTRPPLYATPGEITASIGGVFTASASGTTLSVTAVAAGSLQPGDAVSGIDGAGNVLPPGCVVMEQTSGAPGGIGDYEISIAATLEPCTVTSLSTTLTVTAVAGGVLQAGQTLADDDSMLAQGTLITGQIGGAVGAVGTYSLNNAQTVASEVMTTSMTLLGQVQALAASDLRHMDMLNLQGSHRTFFFNSFVRGIVRVNLKGGDLLVLPDGSIYLITQPVEPWYQTAGWVKVVGTLQDGS